MNTRKMHDEEFWTRLFGFREGCRVLIKRRKGEMSMFYEQQKKSGLRTGTINRRYETQTVVWYWIVNLDADGEGMVGAYLEENLELI